MPRRSLILKSLKNTYLTPAGEAVLAAIIKEHLVTGEAVGSLVLADRFAHGSWLEFRDDSKCHG